MRRWARDTAEAWVRAQVRVAEDAARLADAACVPDALVGRDEEDEFMMEDGHLGPEGDGGSIVAGSPAGLVEWQRSSADGATGGLQLGAS